MRGCTFKRKLPSGKTTWGYSVDAGKDENGKRKRVFKSGFRRESDAGAELTSILQQLNEGQAVKPDPRTFGEFLNEWLKEHAERNCTPKSVERYRQHAAYILPALGSVPLREITSLMLEREYNRLKDAGGKNRKTKAKRPLSAKTVRDIAGVVHCALNTAVRWKLLRTNPATACQLPKVEHKEAGALDETQTEWLLTAAIGHWAYGIIALASATGCRRGELLALTWSDVDFESRTLHVTKSLEQTKAGLRLKTTKNEKPKAIPLPTLAVERLKEHRDKQQSNVKLFGKDYKADLDLVFPAPDGGYLKPDSVTASVCLLAKKAGFKGIALHSLRHSHGSQLLAAGVPLIVVSKRLGHSSVNVTAQVYSHAFTRDELAAAEIWDVKMRKTIQTGQVKQ